MKSYIVKYDTVILGRPVLAKDIVTLTEGQAKPYKAAALIADVTSDEAGKPEPKKSPDKKSEK